MRKPTLLATFTATLTICASTAAQERYLPDWSQISGGPFARHSHSMVYDAARDRIVLFGGRSGQTILSTMWLFDGTTWTEVTPAHRPVGRFDGGIAYDRARQRVVLFGGSAASYLGDTWEWDGSSWTQRFPAQSPSPRRLHAMTYDEARNETVMFGGSLGAPGTWIWDGTNWTQRNVPDPGSREGTTMVWSPYSRRVLLFGGNLAGNLQNDLWQWDGSAWTQLPSQNGPSARTYHAMTYDRHLGGILLFSGFTPDTWFWDGTWHQLATSGGPQSRAQGRLVYMDSIRRSVLFGGIQNTYPNPNPLGDAWSTRFVPTETTFGTGCGSPALSLLPDGGGARIGAVYSPRIVAVPSSPGIAFLGLGLSRTNYGGTPLPWALDPLGMPGCSLYQDLGLAFGLPAQPVVGGQTVAPLPLPNRIELQGIIVHAQAWALAPSVNAAGVVASNALVVRIGG